MTYSGTQLKHEFPSYIFIKETLARHTAEAITLLLDRRY